MRKTLFSTILALTLLGSSSLFAETKVLIDFNQYEQKLTTDPGYAGANGGQQNGSNGNAQAGAQQPASGNNGQQATGGQSAVPEGQVDFKIDPNDMKINHWIVTLNSSSRQMINIKYSYVKSVQTKGKVGPVRTVLGARIHFPTWNNNTYAEIAPPYQFPVYNENGILSSQQNGVISNVGEIYSISAEVYGRNFKNGFYIQLVSENGNLEKYFMGYLYYNGWRRLTWKNPLYIDNIDLKNVVRLPIFPDKGIPYKRLDSFLITRNGAEPGGEFLCYIGNVNMKYDLAVVQEDEDIDQEGTWHILSDNVKAAAATENAARASLIELRKEEEKKMAVVRGVDNTQAGQDATQPAGAQPAAAPAQ